MKLTILISAAVALAKLCEALKITSDPAGISNQVYDYVIAGGGLAGSVLAHKLSKAGFTVLVIEAGADARNVAAINQVNSRNDIPKSFDWAYKLTGENEGATASAGRGLGGSTLINGMVWYRPAPKECDMLGAVAGDSSWSWKSLEPYMIENERFIRPSAEAKAAGFTYEESAHGYAGRINASFSDPLRAPATVKLYRDTFEAFYSSPEFTGTTDLSKREGTVVANAVWNIWHDEKTGQDMRSTAAHGYIYKDPQATLTVLTEHLVNKVVLTGTKATGLTFGAAANKTTTYTVKARKEVIISAGALASPALLQRSGIGHKDDLKAAGIKQLIDLPGVGRNLYDQVGSTITATLNAKAAASDDYKDLSSPFAPTIALASTKQIFSKNWLLQYADLAINLIPQAIEAVTAGAFVDLGSAAYVWAAVTKQIVAEDMPVAELIGESYPGVLAGVFWPLLVYSRGYVRATSASPYDAPLIVPRYNTHSFDLDVGVQSAKNFVNFFKTAPISSIVDNPAADPAGLTTDADYAAWFKKTAYSAAHYGGTCAMMPKAVGGVVNGELKVYGVQSLRVIDGGILPLELTTHTQGMLYPVALRAASLVLKDA